MHVGIDRTFRVFFTEFSFFDLSNSWTIFVSIDWLKLDAMIDRVIPKTAELVLRVIL